MDIEAGDIFKIDVGDGKPAHYWIVLNTPRNGSEILLVSWSDRLNVPAVTDVWALGLQICRDLPLAKPSALFVARARLESIQWISEKGAEYKGRAPKDVLRRARCNMFWFGRLLRPQIKRVVEWYSVDWKPECSPAPPTS